jgi:hypothetical protein
VTPATSLVAGILDLDRYPVDRGYVALLAYDPRPGTDSTPSLELMRYGRTVPVPSEVPHVHAAR